MGKYSQTYVTWHHFPVYHDAGLFLLGQSPNELNVFVVISSVPSFAHELGKDLVGLRQREESQEGIVQLFVKRRSCQNTHLNVRSPIENHCK